jgi:hypothetical protein
VLVASESAAGRGVGRRLETPRAAGIAGLVFSLLFVVAILLSRPAPARGSTAAEIASFYLGAGRGRVVLLGLYLIPFSGIAFLWFIAAIRAHLGERGDRFFATVFIGSGLLFVAMLFSSAAAAGSLLAAVKYQGQPLPGPDTVVFARALAFAFLFVFGVRAAAVFMLVVSTIGLRTGFLPRWLVLAGYVGGLVFLFTVIYVELLVLILPAWVTAVSVVILRAGFRGLSGATS